MPVQRDTITLVCTGNTCRSPMAERLLAHALSNETGPLGSLRVISAGVAARAGAAAAVNAVRILEKVGLDLSDHRSQPLTQAIVDCSVLLLGMTGEHVDIMKAHFELGEAHAARVRDFLPEKAATDVEDPVGMDLEEYAACRDSIVEAIPSVITYLRTQYPGA